MLELVSLQTNYANVLLNALSISALYALVAIGFTMIFGVGGVLNLAHGALITVGGFTAFWTTGALGLSIWAGLLAGALLGGLVAAALYLGVVQFVQDDAVVVLLLTLIIGFMITNGLRIFGQAGTISIPQIIGGSTSFLGTPVENVSIFIFVASWVLIGALFAFVNYTATGKAILAVSMSDKGASLVGIPSTRINLYTWIIGGLFAGFAGVLLTSLQGGSWDMGISPLVLSFAIVVLGGLGSIRGSVIGAYIIGFIDTITVSIFDPQLAGLTGLAILIVVLLVRPQGLLGREATA
ncbi:branched-chain amino acid ABC transporter permease [Halobacteriales archaeon QS_4_69_34]|nr:MAG: branched-chain amino acid ABC transporter permease [Halobacteriales archaeon QS_4_69_34]